jgi:phage baseplate assembly protein gpV
MISVAAFTELLQHFFDLQQRVAQLERDAQRAIKPGRVAAVDPEKGVRLDFGPDDKGEPKLSAWLPHPEQGGEATTWVPPTVGQSLLMITPAGDDTRKAFLVRAGYCDDFTAPVRNLDENVFDFGDARIVVKRGQIVVTVGDSMITIDRDKITFESERIINVVTDRFATIGDTRLGLDTVAEIDDETKHRKVETQPPTDTPAKQTWARIS